MNQTEVERLAAAVAELRTDWPVGSLRTFIARDLSHRAYRDVAVAFAWIATDPDTQTPKRVLEAGPWWAATQATTGDRHPATVRYSDACTTCGRDQTTCQSARQPGDNHEYLSVEMVARERARRYRHERDRPRIPRADYDPAEGSYLPDHYRRQIQTGIAEGQRRFAEQLAALGQNTGTDDVTGGSERPEPQPTDPTPQNGSQPLDHEPERSRTDG